jgi:hypothetical protein
LYAGLDLGEEAVFVGRVCSRLGSCVGAWVEEEGFFGMGGYDGDSVGVGEAEVRVEEEEEMRQSLLQRKGGFEGGPGEGVGVED